MKSLARILTLAFLAILVPAAVPAAPTTQTIVLAGGCFWGMQGVFERLRGVTDTTVGFSGGAEMTAHYDIVSTGATGHAESIKITYDPRVISFERVLDVYFLIAHDPTELNRQGPDEGTQYRSAIFYTTAAQRAASLAYIANLTKRHVYGGPIVTQVIAFHAFYPAEAYHQHYMDHNPSDGYIVYNDAPKVADLMKRFPQLVKR
ncbi:MAG: peptide-methionine (S)-S-oxide reductase MsrA [Candidatus Eremiobacteraeota bacterium]|nr:peptide-methionine (S)-S-oxide reductase MsrA [Candidatus Eremiobacteraeota bacterium]